MDNSYRRFHLNQTQITWLMIYCTDFYLFMTICWQSYILLFDADSLTFRMKLILTCDSLTRVGEMKILMFTQFIRWMIVFVNVKFTRSFNEWQLLLLKWTWRESNFADFRLVWFWEYKITHVTVDGEISCVLRYWQGNIVF